MITLLPLKSAPIQRTLVHCELPLRFSRLHSLSPVRPEARAATAAGDGWLRSAIALMLWRPPMSASAKSGPVGMMRF